MKINGGALKSSQLKDLVDLSYTKKKKKSIEGYEIDKELSDGRVKVYKDLNSDQVIVAHRGSSGWKDWLDNANYTLTGSITDSDTFKKHEKKHNKAIEKYGKDNVIAVGHSRGGLYVDELNKQNPVKEVITYNKPVHLNEIFNEKADNQTDVRSSRDLISSLAPFKKTKNKVVEIESNTTNPLTAHSTSALGTIGDKLIGKGVEENITINVEEIENNPTRFNPKKMRVKDMRKILKNNYNTSFVKMKKPELVIKMKELIADAKTKAKLEGGKFNLGKTLSKAAKSVSKGVSKTAKSIDKGISKATEALDKINPMSIALDDKKTRKLMAQSGEITDKNILPAVVSAGKPLYVAAAMAASTAVTGNPILGKVAADALWNELVDRPGYDPRERQTNKLLGKSSELLGTVLAKSLTGGSIRYYSL